MSETRMSNIDLNIIPLHRQAAKNLDSLPGLHTANPSRKTSRSRRSDQLILMLSFNVPAFSDDRLAELLTRLENMYYEKTGSTTSAMRELIEDLNNLILNLNLRYAGNRPQVTGSIGVIVVRSGHLFLAQTGPGHLFALLPGKVDYLHDEKITTRGLGISRTPQVYYAQMPLDPGNKILFSTSLPESWDANTFTQAYTNPLKKAQQRFLEDSGEELEGFMIEVTEGSGDINLIQPDTVEKQPQPAPSKPVEQTPPAMESMEEEQKPASKPQPLPEVQKTPPAAPRSGQTGRASLPPQQLEQLSDSSGMGPVVSTDAEDTITEYIREEEAPGRSKKQRRTALNLAPALLNGLKRIQGVGQGALRGLKNLLKRMVPGDELIKIPTSYMAFMAVAVPLLVVTVAALVYAQVGRNQQYNAYFSQAETLASAAAAETDANAQRTAWQNTIALVEKAQEYLITDEAESLHKQAVSALDALDNITRLELQPAISGVLANSVRIRQIVATSRDAYMLDIQSDSVLRAWLAGTRYEMDSDFRCGAGQYGSIIVQDLIDISLLPENPDEAVLVAMDKAGNLLYCYEDKLPVAISLIPPDSFWGKPIGITVENDRLYVLDEQLNMVWFYESTDNNYQFREAPYFFFTEEVPNMTDTIDFAIDKEQLYLLYLNGQTTTCTYTGLEEAPTTCTSPTIYNDTRPGRQSGPTVRDAVFYQIQHTQRPEPSLYYLDPKDQSIYQFSLKLNLVQQYRPDIDLGDKFITAFAVSPTKAIFLALENEVYLAYLP
ncbi:MAG: hypothetical protein P8Y72_13180 [Anaerolineales bacterium]